MGRPKLFEGASGKTVRLPDEMWEELNQESGRTKKPLAQIIRERVSGNATEFELQLPLTMFAPCGEPQSMTALTQPFEDAQIKIRGPLTALATPNAFVAIAQGNSMECERVGSIANGDRLLMIPTADFKKELAPGALVLVRITYKDGSEPRITLKKYADIGVLKANNPDHKAPVPDENTESFEALAICAGVLEKQFV